MKLLLKLREIMFVICSCYRVENFQRQRPDDPPKKPQPEPVLEDDGRRPFWANSRPF